MRSAREPSVLSAVAALAALVVAVASCENEGGLLGGVLIEVTGPSGGDVWTVGRREYVTWRSSVDAPLSIFLSRDGNWVNGDGSDVRALASYVAADRRDDDVTVPGPSSPNCRIRVGSKDDWHIYGVSDRFTIRGVVSPSSPWVDVGQPVSFALDAADAAAAAYQWRRDGVDLAGATSATYDVASVTPAEDGAEITCLVTHPWGAVEAAPAILCTRRLTDIGAGLPGVYLCSLAWGDCDNDGDLDLALAGRGDTGRISRIYANTGGVFADIGAGLPGLLICSLAWGDYDNDGDLDLALAGHDGTDWISRVYANTGGAFADAGAGLPGVSSCSLAWGDYDNDGDLDLALAGYDGSGRISRIYANTGGVFADAGAGLPGVSMCSLAWGDYDNDGDLDLALAGYDGSEDISRIYANSGGVFADVNAGLPGLYSCSLAWGDYDNDGDLDLALSGRDADSRQSRRLYRNEGGTFAEVGARIEQVDIAWGDYDNDGDVDLALAGTDASGRISYVCVNGADGFATLDVGLPGVCDCFLAWGDYDNDGDLDLALAGHDGSDGVARIYSNDQGTASNTVPSQVTTGLLASVSGSGPDFDVTFGWGDAADPETAPPGLSYNLRVGTTPGGCEVRSPMAAGTGRRLVAARGMIQPGVAGNSHTLRLPAGTYFWSVQAIDAALAGGPWSAEGTISAP